MLSSDLTAVTKLLKLDCCEHISCQCCSSAAVVGQYDCLQVVCGLDHTLALSQTGKAYAFGDNSLCQLGRVGNMGVQTPDTTPDSWIIHDEDRAPILFTKVVWPVSLAFLSKSPYRVSLHTESVMETCTVGFMHLFTMLRDSNKCKGQ